MDGVVPEDRTLLYSQYDRLDTTPHRRARIVTRGGEMRTVESCFFPVSFRGQSAWGAVIRDVTVADDAVSALKASEEHYRVLFEAAPIGVVTLNADHTMRDANPWLTSMTGYSARELMGRDIRELTLPGSSERGEHRLERIVAGDRDQSRKERLIQTRTGDQKWVSYTTSAVRDSAGAFLYAIRMVEDITERKVLDRAKSQFLAMTSHELRTPFTSIHATVVLAAHGAFGELPERAQQAMETARSNSERLIALVQDILDLERLQLGRDTLTIEPCDAGDIVREAADLIQPLAVESDVSLAVRSVPAPFEGDPVRISRVLTNLLGNAIKFAPPGSNVVAINRHRDEQVEFEVTASGRGIPNDQLVRVFDGFHQVDASG
jgi:PAS domain S-box-containing protein